MPATLSGRLELRSEARRERRVRMPEWIGTLLFFVAIVLSAAKLNKDFGENGMAGYALLMLLIVIYAAAVGVAYV